MSLLTACQAVIGETGLGDVPATIISNTDKTAVQIKALAERAADELAQWNWQAMLREHTITTANGTENYALPSDYARYVIETAWDATNYWPMKGSLNPQLWQAMKRGIQTVPSSRKEYRLRGGEVLIYPTPTGVATLILEYARNTPWVNGSTYRTAATNDADTTVFPERLLILSLTWRWLKAKGVDYSEEKLAAENATSLAFAADTPSPDLDFGTCTEDTPSFAANIPSTV